MQKGENIIGFRSEKWEYENEVDMAFHFNFQFVIGYWLILIQINNEFINPNKTVVYKNKAEATTLNDNMFWVAPAPLTIGDVADYQIL